MSDVKPAQKRSGFRSIAAVLIFVIAAALTPLAMLGNWGHATVVNSEQFLATVGPLAESPQVQAAVSEAVSAAIVKQVDTTAIVGDFLGGLLNNDQLSASLSAPIAAGVNKLIGEIVQGFIASDAFQKVWVTLAGATQKSVVAILQGGNEGPVQMQGDQVVLDISDLLTAVQSQLVAQGVSLADKVTIPESDRQIVLFEAPVVAQLQFVYSLTSPILQWFPLLLAILFGLAITLARRRPRMVLAVGIALVVTGGLTTWTLGVGKTFFVDQLAGTVFGGASGVFWDTLLNYLMTGLQGLMIFGVVVAIAGWFAGSSRPARNVRSHVVAGLTEIGSSLPGNGLSTFLAARADTVRWVITAVTVFILVVGSVMSLTHMIWVLLLAGGLFTLLQVLIAKTEAVAVTAELPAN
jgi:cytochrome oxidase assembly protein ShyY1